MKYQLIGLLLVCSLISSCFSDTKRQYSKKDIQSKQLDSLLTYSHAHGMFNGAIAIIRNDSVIFKKSYGHINRVTDTVINAESIFYIASISKQFTATGIMMLQEKGLLHYDDPIANYLPELKSIHKDVTIRSLLQHTSGISDRLYYQLENPSNQDVVTVLKKQEVGSIGNPNKRFLYSNTGYVLLALIIEKVTGTTIADFFQKEIFDPLHMTQTTTSKEKIASAKNSTSPYNILGQKSTYTSSVIGPSGIYATLNDLLKWNTAINEHTLVSPKTLDLAFTNGTVNGEEITLHLGKNQFGYGFGWMPFIKNTHTYVRHDGSTEGYRTLIRKNLSKNIDIILLTNHGGALAMDEIINSIDAILEREIYTKPTIPLSNSIINTRNKEGIAAVVKMLKAKLNQQNKPDERVLGRLGYTMQNNGKILEAIELYKVNLALYPNSTNALYVLGEAYLQEKNYQLAKDIYRRFLEIHPESKYAIEKKKLIDQKLTKS